MYKYIFFLLLLFIFSGCVERGYVLKSNIQTHTVSAESTIDLDTKSTQKIKFRQMKQAVKQQLHAQKYPRRNIIKHLPKEIKEETIHATKKNLREVMKTQFTEDQLFSSSADDLIFTRTDKIYQKFGNSEIHGHVIYLNPAGRETRLQHTKIYLLEKTKKLDHWYHHYYLKNRNNTETKTTVEYLNRTYLNLSKNFAFHGIAPGTYYIIIVSDIPKTYKNTDQKVYIAKTLKVEKHKKILTVFSKKL